MKIGSGDNGEFTFLDILGIMSFLIGVQNLDYNITQEDMDNTTRKLDNALKKEVDEIHRHLQEQDEKINKILEVLYEEDKETSKNDR